jgi:hypothetical protein
MLLPTFKLRISFFYEFISTAWILNTSFQKAFYVSFVRPLTFSTTKQNVFTTSKYSSTQTQHIQSICSSSIFHYMFRSNLLTIIRRNRRTEGKVLQKTNVYVFNVSNPDVFFSSYKLQISVQQNKPFIFKITFKATCFSSTEPSSGLFIHSFICPLERPDYGSVELKHVALNVILKVKGLLCLTEICN